MDKEALFRNLNRRYCSKREMLPRLPLGVQPDALWQELLQSRRAKSTALPLYTPNGSPYWYVTTDRMIAASEKIVESLNTDGAEFDPFTEPPPVVTLEEAFFTSYVEGAQITMQSAMDFFAGGQPPRDIEEQMLTNNRVAGKFASENLYRGIDAELMRSLAYILTDGMDNGGQDFRVSDEADHASADGERFSFPAAHTVPDRVEELCAFLASPQVHPLIKAGVAQGYLFALRPFPEGNDRLGRILSGMILLRAGYTFFSDVSLSALIARKGYAYYEATANILREENGGDMTYFLEFFMDLLSRAVDERALRRQRREEQDLRAEQDMARTTLTASAEPSPSSLPDEPFEELPEEPEQPIPTVEAPDEEGTVSSTAPPEAADRPSEECMNRVRDLLHACVQGDNERLKSCAVLLLCFMQNGKYTFTQTEFCNSCGFDSKQASKMMFLLRGKGIIESSGTWDGRYMIYRFCTDPTAPQQPEEDQTGFAEMPDSEDLLDGFFTVPAQEPDVQTDRTEAPLRFPEKTPSDISRLRVQDELLRLAEVSGPVTQEGAKLLFGFMAEGKDTFFIDDIADSGAVKPSQVGSLINNIRSKRLIRRKGKRIGKNTVYEFNPVYPHLTRQDYAQDIHDAIRLLRESEQSRKDHRIADLIETYLPAGIINVAECPEYYDEARLKHDMLVPTRMGIVDKIRPGIYRINRKIADRLPELSKPEKALLTALYQTFYTEEFTRPMAIERLDLAESSISVNLHELRVLGLLGYSGKEGRRYWLKVNPVEQPSLFEDEDTNADGENGTSAKLAVRESQYSESFLEMLTTLENSLCSPRDRRLALSLRRAMDKGTLTLNDYLRWGYTNSQWAKDSELAVEIGLVQRSEPGKCILKKAFSPSRDNLRLGMKKAITAIYEAFGDHSFSTEMIVATLNYSESHTYASLHKMALMNVVDQKLTEEGSRYHLLVNPEEHPECFCAA